HPNHQNHRPFPTRRSSDLGAFVIGDSNSSNGTAVTFWGGQWSKLNRLSGGSAPASFKGFGQTSSLPNCRIGWSIANGNASPPTADRKSTRLNSSHVAISYA